MFDLEVVKMAYSYSCVLCVTLGPDMLRNSKGDIYAHHYGVCDKAFISTMESFGMDYKTADYQAIHACAERFKFFLK
jgi:hypothetical protein